MHTNPFEFFQRFWDPTSADNHFFTSIPTSEEIDKKIAEFSTVAQWLKMQLALVEGGITTLEMQKAGLNAFAGKTSSLPTET